MMARVASLSGGGETVGLNFDQIGSGDLYAMCLRGEESAWTYVYNYALRVARDKRWRFLEPDDDAQEVVVRLLSGGIDQVENGDAFRGYLRKITVNCILDRLKKKRLPTLSIHATPDSDEGGGIELPSTQPGPEDLLSGAALQRALDSAMNGLSDRCREVVNSYLDYKMGRFDNLTALAQTYGVVIGTFSSWVTRCLDQLRCAKEIHDWLEN